MFQPIIICYLMTSIFMLDIVQVVKRLTNRSVLVALVSIYLGDIRISSPSLLTNSTLVL